MSQTSQHTESQDGNMIVLLEMQIKGAIVVSSLYPIRTSQEDIDRSEPPNGGLTTYT